MVKNRILQISKLDLSLNKQSVRIEPSPSKIKFKPMPKILFYQKGYPFLQNRVYPNKEIAVRCPTGEIEIVEEAETGLIYNRKYNANNLIYDKNYNNEQGYSGKFNDHLEKVAQLIKFYLGKKNLVEVGCGKGLFLEKLLEKGFDIKGYDPAYEGINPRIKKKYFEPGITHPSRGLILRHVLEHIPEPLNFLHQLKETNGGKGLIYIEVPCLDWIIKNNAWYDIYYEHINYFQKAFFQAVFSKIIRSGRLFQNQYLFVIADLSKLKKQLKTFKKNKTFKIQKPIIKLSKELNYVIWGAASKGVILAIHCKKNDIKIKFAVDINPAKQGKYLPVTGIKVLSPIEANQRLRPKDIVLLTNSNYFKEIKKTLPKKTKIIAFDKTEKHSIK